MTTEYTRCLICGQDGADKIRPDDSNGIIINCRRTDGCGGYKITARAMPWFAGLNPHARRGVFEEARRLAEPGMAPVIDQAN